MTASSRTPAVEVKADESFFVPSAAAVYANLPFSIGGNQQFAVSYRSTVTVDCGCDVKIPAGYQLVLDLDEDLKGRGLDVYRNVLTGECRLSACVRNVGREIVVLDHRCKVFTMRIEPVHPFEVKVVQ